MNKTTIYSNPRTSLTVEDWPIGRNNTTVARFQVEEWRGRERVARVTQKRNGTWSKPVKTTTGNRALICDGDDGQTYILTLHFDNVYVLRGTLKQSHEYVTERDPRYADILALFKACPGVTTG